MAGSSIAATPATVAPRNMPVNTRFSGIISAVVAIVEATAEITSRGRVFALRQTVPKISTIASDAIKCIKKPIQPSPPSRNA